MSGLAGAPELIARLKRIAEEAPKEFGDALYQEALGVQKVALTRCPVDDGPLRASIITNKPVYEGRDISVTIQAGGPSAPYALAVHEHLSEHSPASWKAAEASGSGVHWSVAGTGPKFLEGPLLEAKPTLAASLAKRIDLNGMAR